MTTAPAAVGGVVTVTFGTALVGGVTNARLNFGPTLVDVTELGDTFVSRFPTITDWTLTLDYTIDTSGTDEGQAMIKTAYTTKASKALSIAITGGTLSATKCWVESVDYSADPKEVQRKTVTIKGSSALSFGA